MKLGHLLIFLLAVALLPVIPAQADPPVVLQGVYVMEESGFTPNGELNALASLRFAENGSVIGCRFVQTASGLIHVELTGAYIFDNGRTGTLTLNSSAEDAEGNTVNSTYTYKLVVGTNRAMSALRADAGFLTVGKIAPAADQNWFGTYLLSEISSDRQSARLAYVSLDAARNIDGAEFVNEGGVQKFAEIRGTYEMLSDGFGTLELLTKGTNGDGEEVTVKNTYLFIASRDGIRMMQSNRAVQCVLSMSR